MFAREGVSQVAGRAIGGLGWRCWPRRRELNVTQGGKSACALLASPWSLDFLMGIPVTTIGSGGDEWGSLRSTLVPAQCRGAQFQAGTPVLECSGAMCPRPAPPNHRPMFPAPFDGVRPTWTRPHVSIADVKAEPELPARLDFMRCLPSTSSSWKSVSIM